MTSKLKTDVLETVSGSGTIALTNQLSGMTSASVPSGSVIQVANRVITEETSVTTGSWTAAGGTHIEFSSLESTSSKILVKFNLAVTSTKGGNGGVKLYRNIGGAGWTEVTGVTSTSGTGGSGGSYNTWMTNRYNPVDTHHELPTYILSNEYLDSPSTTSSVAYKIYVRSRNSSFTVYINRATLNGNSDSAIPRATSSATLMEIKG